MSVQTINAEILAGGFTVSQLDSINDAIKFARTKIARVNSVTFRTGSKARMTHARLGGTVTVTVNKVKIKKADIVVDATGARYSVPLSMLEAV